MLLLLACKTPDPEPEPRPTGQGLFAAGCPEAGRAEARVLAEIAEAPEGPDALAAPGDVVLMNDRAAFVIQAPDDPRSYYHYGGLPIDAVAVDGCAQAGPEVLGELGLVVGQLDLADFSASSLHMIRGDRVEVVADGHDGGPAVVEVSGGDDRFWLVELTLIRQVFEGGGRKELGALYDLDLTVRYTLAPDSAALSIEVLLGGEPVTDGFLVGALLFPSDYTEQTSWSNASTSVGGIGLHTGLPWVADARRDGDGATALAMPGGTMARTTIAGVTVLLDLEQAASPLSPGDSASFLLSVGPTDAAGAAAALEDGLSSPVPGVESTWEDLAGTVRDPTGAPVAGATVEVSAADAEGNEAVLTTLTTDGDGRFAGRTLSFGAPWSARATMAGRDDGDTVGIDAGGEGALEIGAAGTLTVAATDDDGEPLAVRVELTRDDGAWTYGYATPQDPTLAVPPGSWTAVVTRGYEHEPASASVTVPEDGDGALEVRLAHVVDTSGWASVDTHVHAGPSPDADELPADRARTAAASGLDAFVSTDHEAIVDLSGAVTEAGLADGLVYGLGSEVTATVPEHTNAWPFPTSEGGRGDPVRWYQLGFPGIYAAERARGAQVVQLNHARVNGECGILCILDWDRQGEPAMDDPEALGLPAGTEIWSWDFDSFELINGLRSPYLTEDSRRSGALYDWLAFFTLGHRVAAMGVTDVHGDGTPGTPRTFVAVDEGFTIDDLAGGVLAGATQVSAGAFARVSVDGAGPGETVTVDDGEAELSLHVEAIPAIDVTTVDVLVDCDGWATLAADDPAGLVKLDTTLVLPVTGDHFVVVIARGEDPMPAGIEDYDAAEVPRVVVSPVFIDGDGDGAWTAPGPKSCGWRPE